MLIIPLVAGIAFAVSGQQNPSIYRQVVSNPDLRNGYEDYLRAADVVNSDLFDVLAMWTSDTYERMLAARQASLSAPNDSGVPRWSQESDARLALAKELDQYDLLTIRKMMVDRYGGALPLVRQGNSKQVWDPRAKADASTVFPEFSRFKALGRLYAADAYVKFAEGDSAGGTRDLLDGLTFTTKSTGSTLIGELVGAATRSILLAAFEEHLARMSDADANQIIKSTTALLQEKPSILTSWAGERDFMLANIDALFEPDTAEQFLVGTDDNSQIQIALNSLTPAEKQQAKSLLKNEIERVYAGLLDHFKGDESTWADPAQIDLPERPVAINSTQDLVDAIVHDFIPTFQQVNMAFLKIRAQLRLLRLHGYIGHFRWQHDRLPKDLAEAVPRDLLFDPLANENFHYEVRDKGYVLFSRGKGSTGVIELKYRRPIGGDPVNQRTPPPVLVNGMR